MKLEIKNCPQAVIVVPRTAIKENQYLKSALQLFNLPWQLFLILICFALIFIVIKFNYKKLQRIFLFMILFYIAYIISAILTKPNWGEAIQESFIFPKKINIADFRYWFSLDRKSVV